MTKVQVGYRRCKRDARDIRVKDCPHGAEPYFVCPQCDIRPDAPLSLQLEAALALADNEWVRSGHVLAVETILETLDRLGYEVQRKSTPESLKVLLETP